MPTVFDLSIIRVYQKFANLFKVWLYVCMKTKTLIIFLLFIVSMAGGMLTVNSSFAYAPPLLTEPEARSGGGGGGPCPGCVETYGCKDFTATNYNESATVDDGSCNYNCPPWDPTCSSANPIRWCRDPLANNYYFVATEDDGSCTYDETNPPIVIYWYCDIKDAINYQTQKECREEVRYTDSRGVEYKARPQDSCIINNTTCEYESSSPVVTPGSTSTSTILSTETNPVPLPVETTNTLCLRQEFSNMPDFSDMTVFNNTYKICSNGGTFTKTNSITKWSTSSFSGYCENSSSIDNNQVRCTYSVLLEDIVILPPPFFITGTVIGIWGIGLPNVQVNLTTFLWETRTVATDLSGNYIFNSLDPGEYVVRPNNSMPYIFPHSEEVNLSDSNATVNFTGIDTTTVVAKTDFATLLNNNSSIDDWLRDLSDKWNNIGGNMPDSLDSAILSNARNGESVFSNNSLSSLFNNGFLPLSNSYTPIPLSLIPKYADENSVCGDWLRQTGETCDDGINNGKAGYCSSDCLYRGEVKFVANNNNNNGNSYTSAPVEKTISLETLSTISDTVGRNVSGGMKILQTSIRKASDSIGTSQNLLKQKIIENTSPRTREILKQAAEVAVEVAQYSVIAVASIVAAFAGALHIMAYKAQWVSYTVQAGDTIDSLGNKFTMTERAMRSKNGLKKWELRPGTKIKVRNRHLIEKDYLDQLKFVLQDSLEKRNYGKMSAKIDKMFAKN